MTALIVVDMQKDFMPGGTLPVKKADTLVPLINQLIEKYPLALATKDWHPKDHVSFASNHKGKKEGDVITIEGTKQILWPVHCVQGTPGAEFIETLHAEKFAKVFYKGTDVKIDSYSTFFDNAHLKETGLSRYLQELQIKKLLFVGVATDYCVLYSVCDALELGYNVIVVKDGCLPVNLHEKDEEKAFEEMQRKGAKVILSTEVL